jgi:hypothetical protein
VIGPSISTEGMIIAEVLMSSSLMLKCFSPPKILNSLLFEETLGAFFHAPSHEDSGILMILEEKITSPKTSFQMTSIY